jgi:hypothetical protein
MHWRALCGDPPAGDDKMAGDDNAILPIVLDSSEWKYLF